MGPPIFHYSKDGVVAGNAKFKIGSSTGTLIGEIPNLPNTGSYDNFLTYKITLDQDVVGVSDLYIIGLGFGCEWFELSPLV